MVNIKETTIEDVKRLRLEGKNYEAKQLLKSFRETCKKQKHQDLLEYRRRNRKKLLTKGVCPMCENNKLVDGRKMCQTCYEKYYKKRKKKGLCIHCGRKAREERTTCEKCADKIAKSQKKRYKRMKKENKCPRCGNDSIDYVYCSECRKE